MAPSPSDPSRGQPCAVMDIGSNTVRLVVYDADRRAPLQMYNEGVNCRLGRGLGTAKYLPPEATDAAVTAIRRFVGVARSLKVQDIRAVATAAVREAADGNKFRRRIKADTGVKINILDGAEEARLSALGVVAGIPRADGVVGDLGGGSLELIELKDGHLGRSATLPLGTLRLATKHGDDMAAVDRAASKALSKVDWLTGGQWSAFFLVGGSWRALAQAHMDDAAHPLRIIQGYAIKARDASKFAAAVRDGSKDVEAFPTVPNHRRASLPIASTILGAALRAIEPVDVVFSAQGLREGLLFDRLDDRERGVDPLLETAAEMARREQRFGEIGSLVFDWLSPLIEADDDLRLWHASCLLADIAWREHPSYRAEQAMLRILRFPFLGIDHPGRAFLAYAAYTRHGGDTVGAEARRIRKLMSKREIARARVLGEAERLAFRVAAGMPEILGQSRLVRDGRKSLTLHLPEDGSSPPGEALTRQLATLVKVARIRAGKLVG